MCISVSVCICMCISVCVFARVSVCVYLYMGKCMCLFLCVFVYVFLYMCKCMCICMCICVEVDVFVGDWICSTVFGRRCVDTLAGAWARSRVCRHARGCMDALTEMSALEQVWTCVYKKIIFVLAYSFKKFQGILKKRTLGNLWKINKAN